MGTSREIAVMVMRQPIKRPIKPGSIVDQRRGRPTHLLKSDSNLSLHQNRKAAVGEHYELRSEQRKSCKP